MHDKDLIQGCVNEDRSCQRMVYERYASKMMTVCLRYSRHRLEAEDILQDGFVKVFNNLEKFQFKGSFEGWIRRIMVNTALKNFRKSSVKKELIGIEDYEHGSEEPDVLPRLSAEVLLKLVSELPAGYKVVFNLYAIEGFSHREIAETLEIKESTSRSQLVKARKMLQNRIAKLEKKISV